MMGGYRLAVCHSAKNHCLRPAYMRYGNIRYRPESEVLSNPSASAIIYHSRGTGRGQCPIGNVLHWYAVARPYGVVCLG
jgi:hypothetical protein